MYSITDTDKGEVRGKLWGLLAMLLYFALLGLLMMLIHFARQDTPPVDQGIMINFGDSETGSGDRDTPLTDNIGTQAAPVVAQPAPEVPSPHGDVEVPQRTPARPHATHAPVVAPQVPRQQVDRQALFPGRTVGSTSTSEGVTGGAGNQGSLNGSPDGSHDGTGGTGNSGTASFSLDGRAVIGGILPKPQYNSSKEGQVVVEITVNPAGSVVSAVYRAAGSKGVDSVMIADALAAARKAKFNNVSKDNLQVGTITYVFKLNR